MNQPFDFSTAGRIVFGCGSIGRLPEIALGYGHRAFVVVGSTGSRATPCVVAMERAGAAVASLSVVREPNVDDIAKGVRELRAHRADVVVAIGGGSVMDTAKAIAAISGNEGDLLDYLEVIGRAQPLSRPSVPCIAVPTTAGTGAEVTRNAVIDVPEHDVKVSLRSEHLVPRVALLDPELTLTVPSRITAETGFDAFAQVMEPYVSNRANPMTDSLALDGIRRASKALRRAYLDGRDLEARSDMALVSLYGGICLANARLGAVHGLAGPLGGMFHVPHGALCAALLGPVMRVNIAAARERGNDIGTLRRYEDIARIVTGDPGASADDGAAWIERLAADLGIRRLSAFGIPEGSYAEIVARAMRASSMQGNPVVLERSEIAQVLAMAN